MTAARTSRAATASRATTSRTATSRVASARTTTQRPAPRTASARGRAGASTRSASRGAAPRSSSSRTSTTARSTTARTAPARATGRGPAARSTTSRRTAPRPTNRSRPANSSRAAARSLPQETTGPLLRVLPRRNVSLRTTLAISTLLFFAVLAGAVTIQAYRIQAQHRVDVVQARLSEAEDANRSLRAEVAIAESPDRIMAEALAMGMVEPGPVLPLVSTTPTTAPESGTAAPNDGGIPPVTDEGTAAR